MIQDTDALRDLIAGIPFGVITFTTDGQILNANKQARKLLNIKSDIDQLTGLDLFGIIKSDRVRKSIKRLLDNKRKGFNLQRIHVGGRYVNIRGKKLKDNFLITIIDTTENVESQDTATLNLILGQERERTRMSKEIHDGVGPMMSTIKLQVDALYGLATNEKVKSKLDSINQMIIDTSRDIRQISHDLMPSSLKDFGLVTAIENMAKRINEHNSMNITIFYQLKIEEGILDHVIELNIFRIVQEVINNAIKYSECTEIHIQLRTYDDKLQLTIEDNGKGMNIEEVESGMGLQNIATRVKTLHGIFEMESSPGNGLLSQIIIPLKTKK
ncbi:sensor histidine kinase [Portibacter lacus]|uniref:histidine kinase n=1 Tax=Portibacter lacus TaxID=1099794 RepID=A0AA37SMM7_9BACT|nr:sensor histidine kinase [Portibacter lacus]GLR15591.1 hypothetical protein GCM10007940_02060 [Portibacter lacus]